MMQQDNAVDLAGCKRVLAGANASIVYRHLKRLLAVTVSSLPQHAASGEGIAASHASRALFLFSNACLVDVQAGVKASTKWQCSMTCSASEKRTERVWLLWAWEPRWQQACTSILSAGCLGVTLAGVPT